VDASSKRPTSGVRYAIERVSEAGTVTEYRGFAHLPAVDLALAVRVDEPESQGEGRAAVAAKIEGEGSEADVPGLEKAAAALVKAAVRAARDAGRPLPRRIVRWRP